jgi:hypothetical protein
MIGSIAGLAELALRPSGIVNVIVALKAIDARLPKGDGVKWFNLLYLRVTEAVHTSLLNEPRQWRDAEWITQLDVDFAGLYFEALRVGEQDPAKAPSAWQPLLLNRSRKDLAPIQFALAGMNAHINRDLPVAVETTSGRLGRRVATGSRQHADYLAVNAILERIENQVKVEFATGLVGVADAALGRLDDVLAMWSVARARDAAWTHGMALRRLALFQQLHDDFLSTLDSFTGFAGRGLLTPVLT